MFRILHTVQFLLSFMWCTSTGNKVLDVATKAELENNKVSVEEADQCSVSDYLSCIGNLQNTFSVSHDWQLGKTIENVHQSEVVGNMQCLGYYYCTQWYDMILVTTSSC